MLRPDDLIALINNLDSPVLTDFFNIDVSELDKYVKPVRINYESRMVIIPNSINYLSGGFLHI